MDLNHRPRHYESPGTASALQTDELQLFISPDYNQSGKVMIRQSDPQPLTVVDITIEATVGG